MMRSRVRLVVGVILIVVGTASWARAQSAPASEATGSEPGYAVAFEAAMFYLFAGTTVLSAVGVCLAKKIDRMAVALFFALGSVAVLYFLLAANFIAAVQLIVYVGGVLVLLIFGVMLTSKSPWVRFDARPGELIAAGLVCAGLLVCLLLILVSAEWGVTPPPAGGVHVERIGRSLVTDYLVPFEAAGVLLMIVMVGAAHLARQERQGSEPR